MPDAVTAEDPAVAVRVRELVVDRGGRRVLPGLSFDLQRGAITGLLGPSGCGKSTLLRAIVGVQIVAGGAITIGGTAAGASELRPRIGYVTQQPSVYDDLTVRENLTFFARVLRVEDPRTRVAELIDLVGLASHADARVDALSGGQRSRVSLAAALVGRPELLVLDEPTVGLDPLLREQLWATFVQLAEAEGVTLIVSSHVMDEAARCGRLLLMYDGELIADDTPAGIRARAGTDDLDACFLALVRARMAGQGAGGGEQP